MIRDYLDLTKPRVTWLILMSTAVGFYLGAAGALHWVLFIHTLLGTALVAGGTAALNQWMEREADGKMRRTDQRPLPAGRLAPLPAFAFGLLLSLAGIAYLAAAVNTLSALLAVFTCSSYLLAYTPLKSRTPLSTLVGAFPGAVPILIGFTAATGRLTLEGWILYAILFLWQFPHFLAIATLYREDYQRAGIVMLPVVDPAGAGRQILLASGALLAVTTTQALLGLSGAVYLTGTLALGFAFFYYGWRVARRHTKLHARRLLQVSVFYLPLVYSLLVLDRL